MSKQIYQLPEERNRAAEAIRSAPAGVFCTLEEQTRTVEQNAVQWPILTAFAKQKQAVINGKAEWVSADDWKDILTAAFNQELTRVALGLDGRMVLLGQRTSKFGVKKFSDWIDFLNATAIAMDVKLPARRYYSEEKQ